MNLRPLILLATGAAILVPLLFFVTQGRFAQAAFLTGGVFFLLIFRRMDLWWIAAVVTLGSNLQLLSRNAPIHLLASLGFVALGVMGFIMTQGRSAARFESIPRKAATWLMLIIVITASLRGWGLRILGSSMWGGTQYIVLIAAICFFMFSYRVRLTEKRMWWTVRALFVLGALPAIALLLGRALPGAGLLGLFIGGVGASSAEMVAGTVDGGERLQGLQLSALWAGLLAMLLYDRSFVITPKVVALALFSFVMMGLSGHRNIPVLLGFTVLFYLYIRRVSVPPVRYLNLLLVLGVGLICLYMFVERLPLPFQRTVAWLPGIQVSHFASLDAYATTSWRIEMWKSMLPMIPEFLLLGRGMGFSLAEAYAAYTLTSDVERQAFFIATHNYHSGPLWLLVDLGLAGFVAGVVLLFGGIGYFKRHMQDIPEGSRWRSAYVVIFSGYSAYCISFFLVIGSGGILARILVLASVLEVIIHSVRAEQSRSMESSEAEERPKVISRPAYVLPEGRMRPRVVPVGLMR